ncbi:unnamed protein product [Closterium sp. NIES-65]|nr:unnamed protein product [Closterium sp. NIES-65]
MARANGAPATFRCSIGWVRRALRRQGVRCMSAVGEVADQDLNAVRTNKEKLLQLLMHLGVRPRDTFNFDETALYISVLPRKTYGTGRSAGRKLLKERLTVGLLVNAEGSHAFRPLVISKAKRPHDFRPDFDPEEYCYWRNTAKGWMTKSLLTHFIEQMDTVMHAEGRNIVVLLDNASSHTLTTEGAITEDLFGFRTRALKNVRLVYLPPDTTCFTQALDQGMIAMTKARHRQQRAATGSTGTGSNGRQRAAQARAATGGNGQHRHGQQRAATGSKGRQRAAQARAATGGNGQHRHGQQRAATGSTGTGNNGRQRAAQARAATGGNGQHRHGQQQAATGSTGTGSNRQQWAAQAQAAMGGNRQHRHGQQRAAMGSTGTGSNGRQRAAQARAATGGTGSNGRQQAAKARAATGSTGRQPY